MGVVSFKYIMKEKSNKMSAKNEMPELKPGMVVETTIGVYLYIDEDLMIHLENRTRWCDFVKGDVVRLYEKLNGGLNSIHRNLEKRLVWDKYAKTEEQKKIEELEKTIKEAQRQIEELKNLK